MRATPIEIAPYDHNWVPSFQKEALLIQSIAGDLLAKIHHIGSTAIPGMPAKPIIDLLAELSNLDDILEFENKIVPLGYAKLSRSMIPHRTFITTKLDPKLSYNLHICEQGDPQVKRHVFFHEYLKEHLSQARLYALLKEELAKEFKGDRIKYTMSKALFVHTIDGKAKLMNSEKQQSFLEAIPSSRTKNWSVTQITHAQEANFNVYLTHFAQYISQIELIRVPGYTIVNTKLNVNKLNYVTDIHLTSAEAGAKVNEIVAYFNENNIPFTWWLGPHDEPSTLPGYLTATGLRYSGNFYALYLQLAQWEINSSLKLTIKKITTRAEFLTLANIYTDDQKEFQIYYHLIAHHHNEDDPLEYYIGYLDKEPVTCAALNLYGQIAGIYHLATFHNDQNYRWAIEQHLAQRAQALDYQLATFFVEEEKLNFYLQKNLNQCGLYRQLKNQTF